MVIASSKTFSKIEQSGLLEKCKEKFEIWSPVLRDRWSERAEEIVGEIKNSTQQTAIEKRVLKAEKKLDAEHNHLFGKNSDKFFIENPSLLAYFILGNDVEKYADYGFVSEKELEESIVAVCIGDKTSLNRISNKYQWRNDSSALYLSNEHHGDMSCGQVQTEFEGVWKERDELDQSGFSGGQCGWGPFLISLLRFAQEIDYLDIPEIKEWQQKVDGLGNTWSTIDLNGPRGFAQNVKSALEDALMGSELWNDKTHLPLDVGESRLVVPYVKDNNLLYLTPSENGDFEIETNYKLLQKPLSVVFKLTPDDLPWVLNGTYKLFARTRQEVPSILEYFWEHL